MLIRIGGGLIGAGRRHRVGHGGGLAGDRSAVHLDNVRDIGGLPTASGGLVRSGLLFRSAEPSSATTSVHGGPGLALICDLRSPREREAPEQPYAVVPTVYIEMMSPEDAAGETTAQRILADAGGRTARSYMFATYRAMPARLGTAGLCEFVRRFAEPAGRPALVHCRAGKDRTGVFCAILLLALGVPHEAVVADYMLSDREFGVERLLTIVGGHAGYSRAQIATVDPTAVDPMRVRPEYLDAALAEITRQWGGLDGYLASAGLSELDLVRLRDVLVT